MFDFFNGLLSQYISNNFLLDIIVSFAITCIVLLSVMIAGFIVDFLENVCLNLLTWIAGANFALIVCNYLTLPGVIVHELSHAFFVFLTGATLTELRLFEFCRSGRLGHVSFRTVGNKRQQGVQLAFISCAPVLVGFILEYIMFFVFVRVSISGPLRWFLYYLIFSVGCHMSMSNEDIINYFKGIFVVFPFMFSVFLFVQYFFVR